MHQGEKFVCVYCFEEPALVRFVREKAVSNDCSFCPARDSVPIATSMDMVAEYFIKCLLREYDFSVNQIGWDGSEGGWTYISWDAYELALDELELEFPQENERELLPYLFGDYFDLDWCEANGYGLNDLEWARYSWDHFCKVVMQERRFFFLSSDRDPDDPEVSTPGEVLRAIFDYAQRMDLFIEIPSGTRLIRVRLEGCKPHLETAEELGPPPAEKAKQSNRMSPAGVPMFYGCEDEETALRETKSDRGYYAVGEFETLHPATLLDLTAIPPVPSLFDSVPEGTEIQPRRMLKFLHHVAREVSRPIERGDREHIEYVPTQIITEFVRGQVAPGKSRVDGIKYSSSVHPGHDSFVLFANQNNIESTSASEWSDDVWLKLAGTKHTWVD